MIDIFSVPCVLFEKMYLDSNFFKTFHILTHFLSHQDLKIIVDSIQSLNLFSDNNVLIVSPSGSDLARFLDIYYVNILKLFDIYCLTPLISLIGITCKIMLLQVQ